MPEVSFKSKALLSQDLLEDTAQEATPRITFRMVLWPLALSLLVLGVIGYFTFEPGPFRQMLHNLNPWFLAAAVATVGLRVFFGGWRLSYVSRGRLTLLDGIQGQLAWDFFSNITPSTIGGGPIAAAYIAHDRKLPLGEATALMLFSMLLDQVWFAFSIPIILVSSAYLEIIPSSLGTIGAWSFTVYFLMLMGWMLVFGYATLFRPELLERLVGSLCRIRGLRRFRPRALRVMRELQGRAFVLRSQPLGFYLKGFFLTLGTWAGRYLLVVFVIWSVYPNLDALLTFLRSIALTLGSLILPTPGGAGGLEGLYALFLGPPLMPEALVAPTLLTWRLLGYYVFIALGAFLSMHQVQKTIQRKKQDTPISHGDGLRNGTPVLQESEPVEHAK